jgi:UDP-N-acetylglucosamine diphosphorylase / glucose-1-phosphate thymidylyltransferase / UDP-N-acetylgalactosamine diphosphorylase / glucosamine-1-phosphate N-acetyltransferase / galactosamine-1-phosphate N-acetyltransferase
MAVIVFEDDGHSDFAPITTLRHVSLLRWGTRTLLDSVRTVAAREVSLWGREELAELSMEVEETEYNAPAAGEALLVNARARPDRSLRQLFERSGRFVAKCGSHVVAARLDAGGMEPGVIERGRLLRLSRGLDVLELPTSSVFLGCWQLVGSNGLAITEQAARFPDQLELPASATVKGPASNLMIHESAEIEGHVSFDARLGPIVVSEGASLESFSRLSGPCYVGSATKVHSGLIREGTSVFEGCRIGGEVENSIVMPHTNKSHHGYVGDSIVGEWVNLGAGSTFSNLKNTYGTVKAEVGEKRIDTGMTKFGPMIGDMAKVSIGAMVYGGKTVGVGSHVSGLVDRSVPSFTSYEGKGGKMVELLLDSVIETQERMMERRGLALTKRHEDLIRTAFRQTRRDRVRAHVRKGRIR